MQPQPTNPATPPSGLSGSSTARAPISDAVQILEAYLRGLSRAVVIASFVMATTGLILPFAINRVYDRVVPQDSVGTLVMLTAILLGCAVVEIVMKSLRGHLLGRMAVVAAWRNARAALDVLAGYRAGQAGHRARRDWLASAMAMSAATEATSSPVRLFLVELVAVPVFFVLLALTAGALALVPLAVCAVGLAITLRVGRRYRDLHRAAEELEIDLRQRQEQFVGAAGTLRSLGALLVCEQDIAARQAELAHRRCEALRMMDHIQALGAAISGTTQLATIAIGSALAILDTMTAGLVICCSILATRIAQPFTRLAIAWAELETEATAAARHAVCRQTPAVTPGDNRQDGPRSAAARVKISGAAATYEASEACAIRDVDLVIAPGECITIVGNDSSAKLALLRLIAGEGAPAQGAVFIDGEPATSASRTGIAAVAMLSELPGMTQDTILANITLHRPWIGTERARGAARLVGLEPDILRLPAGYETRLSGGTCADLSSGMRKRIGLARTIAGAPRLLILSEPQVGLDLAAQGQLEALIAGIKGRCTIVLTTNAPRLARCGDRVFEIRDGRLSQVAVRPQVQPGGQPSPAVQGAAA